MNAAVAVVGYNSPYGLCGGKAALNLNMRIWSIVCKETRI